MSVQILLRGALKAQHLLDKRLEYACSTSGQQEGLEKPDAAITGDVLVRINCSIAC
jgi:hypothetical protein